MKVFVGFIWTDYRDVPGQWRYELRKADLLAWMVTNAKKRYFDKALLFDILNDVELLQLDLETYHRQPNLLKAVNSFLEYVERTQSDIFLDNQPNDL